MNTKEINSDDASLSVDLSEARQAVKENRFKDALGLFEIILKEDPNHIDSLYLASVSSRYLKKFDDSKIYLISLYYTDITEYLYQSKSEKMLQMVEICTF